MARRSQSPIADVMDITSKLPWWVGMSLAVVSYVVLHWFANKSLPTTGAKGAEAIYAVALPGMLRGFASFGQVVLPIVFLLGTFVSVFNGYKRKKLHTDTAQSHSANPLDEINWQDFELQVGKHFHQQGFVTKGTAGGANGGDN
jgi:restriction system protein